MPSLFQSGVEQGSNAVSVQQGQYVAAFDIAAGGPVSLSWAYDDADEILDLADPTSAHCPAGVYFISTSVQRLEEEAGTSMVVSIQIGGFTWSETVDLGISSPATTGGYSAISGAALVYTDGAGVLSGAIQHDRAGGNLTGEVFAVVTRMF